MHFEYFGVLEDVPSDKRIAILPLLALILALLDLVALFLHLGILWLAWSVLLLLL